MQENGKRIGAWYIGPGVCEFTVWAPGASQVDVVLFDAKKRVVSLEKRSGGYWRAGVEQIHPMNRYLYSLDRAASYPDPASAYQPDGVHKPSAVVDHASFDWSDRGWRGIPLESMIIYELHVGTFTPEGTFDAVAERLPDVRELGINAVEIMPVAQFPGERNWGYDGVFPFAVQNSYGGPDAFKRLIDRCHALGIAVVLDVVYNHFGPEGGYAQKYGPYCTDRYKTPWGQAMNFDGPASDEVRNFFIQNALYWLEWYHIDALRLDAVHSICDMSAKPFLAELTEQVAARFDGGRKRYLIAESDLNDAKIIRDSGAGGYGFDAQWSDDFHHSLHALLTGETDRYYCDFGTTGHLHKAFAEGFVYSGEYSSYRGRRHGNASAGAAPSKFVVFSQNHDQVGNRRLGERLSTLVSFERQKLAAAAVLLGPYVPLLFMGEEYGEPSPFLYFVSFDDPALIEAVSCGRRIEYGENATIPDPQAEAAFLESKLKWRRRREGAHASLYAFYRTLIALRVSTPSLSTSPCAREAVEVCYTETDRVLCVFRGREAREVCCCFNFGPRESTLNLSLRGARWEKTLDSADAEWLGGGSEAPAVLYGPTAVLPMKKLSVVVYKRLE